MWVFPIGLLRPKVLELIGQEYKVQNPISSKTQKYEDWNKILTTLYNFYKAKEGEIIRKYLLNHYFLSP